MTITITIDNAAEATRVLNGFCSGTNYDSASGITKADWMVQQLGLYVKQKAMQGEFKVTAASVKSDINAIVVH